ncbi:DUF6257 family protein [Streptomyces sp. NBC_01262]|uniref:DUF6257 family protein n=1 Tax=Streptomyces sp. NBC_01262 TaxID=2903803 RepID=UPI002E311C65|nr:DUF6257 family protein [Streptomyces sp. NBC_01262]
MAAEDKPEYTTGEKWRRAGLIVRGCKRSLAGENVDLSDIDSKLDRIDDQARKRAAKKK